MAADTSALKVQGSDTIGNPLNTLAGAPGLSSTTRLAQGATSSGGNQVNTVSIPAVAGKLGFVSGFAFTCTGATASTIKQLLLSFLAMGTMTFDFVVPAGVGAAGPTFLVNFNPPLPAAAVNTPITLTVPALGAGNTNASAQIWGYTE